MATPLDLLYVALFAAAVPLYDYVVSWPAFRRRLQTDPTRAKTRFWAMSIGWIWALVAIGSALWLSNDRSWAALGFSVPGGWRLWASVALVQLLVTYVALTIVTVARDPAARASVREQIGKLTAATMPRTRAELYWFGGVALTAGFCEEFLFRGYFIWVFAPWIGWWGAAAVSVLVFAGLHAYQGWSGVLRVGILGVFFTLVVAIFNSLWPAIALHALVDLHGGILAWLALRGEPANGGEEEGAKQPEPQSAPGIESDPLRSEPGAAADRGGT
ncbi:CPBP family intramembrane metalloprotease [Gemmata sp. G18]|uniref:CPBP family intramembrane metalloprotease n=1 Tax=Gemmata palustris TaxID=2822762 RepID=A0ABS5C232_9BACT|nr:CPBP family intramembrane glutamic endopeptidase [Gemmata palustris]MBP3960039.1 CPBP family intramembrane metalloprotease [Gemmata palustris]